MGYHFGDSVNQVLFKERTSDHYEMLLHHIATVALYFCMIFGNNSGQAYLPLNLTIPPTYLVSGDTITLRIYGYVTAALHYMVDDPLIDARVNIVYP